MKPITVLSYIFGSLLFAFILLYILAETFIGMFMARHAIQESWHAGVIFAAVVTLCVLVCIWGSVIFTKLDSLAKKSPDDKTHDNKTRIN